MSGLPEGWAEAPLSDLVSVTRGITFTKIERRDAPEEGFLPCLRTSNVQSELTNSRMAYVPSSCVKRGDQFVTPGDLIISMSNSSELVGKVALATDAHSGFSFGAFLAALRSSAFEPRALWYLVRSARVQQALRQTSSQTTNIANISAAGMAKIELPVAPLAEQRRIVAKLDALTARTARARADLDHVPALLARYRQAVLATAFNGELTKDLRATTDKDGLGLRSRLLQQRQDRLRTTGASPREVNAILEFGGETELPSLPPGWTWMPVQALATKVTDGVHKKPNYTAEGVPFLTVRNLTAGPGVSFDGCRFVSEDDHAEFCKRTSPEFGDILITKDGTLGVVRAVRTHHRFSIFVSLALVKPVDLSMSDYLELAFTAPVVQGQMVGVGSGLQHIHLTDLRRDMIPVAPEIERTAIVARVRSAFDEIERIASEAAGARRLLDRLDQAILTKAFRGELVPQDPNDEPASLLLERIRAERSAAPKPRRGQRAAA